MSAKEKLLQESRCEMVGGSWDLEVVQVVETWRMAAEEVRHAFMGMSGCFILVSPMPRFSAWHLVAAQ